MSLLYAPLPVPRRAPRFLDAAHIFQPTSPPHQPTTPARATPAFTCISTAALGPCCIPQVDRVTVAHLVKHFVDHARNDNLGQVRVPAEWSHQRVAVCRLCGADLGPPACVPACVCGPPEDLQLQDPVCHQPTESSDLQLINMKIHFIHQLAGVGAYARPLATRTHRDRKQHERAVTVLSISDCP